MMPKRLMLIGQSECGKTTLIQSLQQQPLHYQKTQTLDFVSSAIDTPGEYLENPRLYSALINASYDADVIAFVQSASNPYSIFAPQFASAFNKPVIGVVTKVDTLATSATEAAQQQLENAGVSCLFKTSSYQHVGIHQLRQYLNWS
ncbi:MULTISPECIES: EutP/PduV family microcompartment system protein [unclassified Agarivorans]|uniref:EutP/PduV family microcompartment system protein n=1 Tax=unclassified Agarivorans TaxID=2636026 RepID=UPI003D7EBA71